MTSNAFPDVLKLTYQMNNSDLCVVGQHLGYHWNQVCGAIRDAGFYAEDGDGAQTVERYYHDHDDEDGEEDAATCYSENPIIQRIMEEIFAHYPDVQEISIVN